jgi:Tfp pilus assembly protein PilX
VNPVLAKRRQSGALLLTVSLLLAVMAALAFGLNRAGGMEANAVTADYDQRNAAYLAEAAVAAAKWKTQLNNKCANVQIPAFTFGDGSISAAVKDSGAKHIDVTASATTAAGSVVSLTRTKLDIVNFASPETKDLGGAVQDTYVDRLNTTTSFGTGTGLVLTGGQTNVLLSWDTKDIPADAEVMSASLMLTQDGGSPTARTVNVHRVADRRRFRRPAPEHGAGRRTRAAAAGARRLAPLPARARPAAGDPRLLKSLRARGAAVGAVRRAARGLGAGAERSAHPAADGARGPAARPNRRRWPRPCASSWAPRPPNRWSTTTRCAASKAAGPEKQVLAAVAASQRVLAYLEMPCAAPAWNRWRSTSARPRSRACWRRCRSDFDSRSC